MKLSLSHWYPGSGVMLDCTHVLISDLWPLSYLYNQACRQSHYFHVIIHSFISFCSVALPHGAVGWSSVDDCGIS